MDLVGSGALASNVQIRLPRRSGLRWALYAAMVKVWLYIAIDIEVSPRAPDFEGGIGRVRPGAPSIKDPTF